MKIAVVDAGISGVVCVPAGAGVGASFGVDPSLLVFNDRTYPTHRPVHK